MKLRNYFLYTLCFFIQCSLCRKANDRNRNLFHFKEENLFLNENELINTLEPGRRHKIRHHHEEIHWPVKKIAVVEGDIVLGGLMMVHEREDSVMCGPVMPQGGIQALEAMLYTLDRLNNDEPKLLPDISIGAHILDDCDRDTYGLEMALDFIKGRFKQKTVAYVNPAFTAYFGSKRGLKLMYCHYPVSDEMEVLRRRQPISMYIKV